MGSFMTRYINFDDHDRYRHARPGTEPRSWCDRWTYALSQLASAELPAYEPDDGPLAQREIRAIQKLAGGRRGKSVRSSLF